MAKIGLDYIEIDGLLYPNLEVDNKELLADLGKYGRLRLEYLHSQEPQIYRQLLFTGKLAQHCAEVEQRAFVMAERIREQYFQKNPPPAEGMERIQVFTQAQMLADEIVTAELICL